jgi:hypothetical protein
MDSVKLVEELRGLPGRIPEDERYWLDRIRPQLPAAPFTPAFLDELLAPLSPLEQADVLDFLARLGRKEVAEIAAIRVERAAGIAKLYLGTALLSCGDGRGYGALEELYRHSLDFPDDKPNSVPLGWIVDDVLLDEFQHDDAAMALRLRLIALQQQRNAQKN